MADNLQNQQIQGWDTMGGSHIRGGFCGARSEGGSAPITTQDRWSVFNVQKLVSSLRQDLVDELC